jgi:hypothetical protein
MAWKRHVVHSPPKAEQKMLAPDRRAALTLAAQLRTLHWNASAVRHRVKSDAVALERIYALRVPKPCADMTGWAASGYRTLPQTTKAFLHEYIPVKHHRSRHWSIGTSKAIQCEPGETLRALVEFYVPGGKVLYAGTENGGECGGGTESIDEAALRFSATRATAVPWNCCCPFSENERRGRDMERRGN